MTIRGVSETRACKRPVTSEGRGPCEGRSSQHDRSNCIVPATRRVGQTMHETRRAAIFNRAHERGTMDEIQGTTGLGHRRRAAWKQVQGTVRFHAVECIRCTGAVETESGKLRPCAEAEPVHGAEVPMGLQVAGPTSRRMPPVQERCREGPRPLEPSHGPIEAILGKGHTGGSPPRLTLPRHRWRAQECTGLTPQGSDPTPEIHRQVAPCHGRRDAGASHPMARADGDEHGGRPRGGAAASKASRPRTQADGATAD